MDKTYSSWIWLFTTVGSGSISCRIRSLSTRTRNAGYRGREDKELVSESQCATNSYTQYLHSADSKYVFLTFKFKKKINVTRKRRDEKVSDSQPIEILNTSIQLILNIFFAYINLFFFNTISTICFLSSAL